MILPPDIAPIRQKDGSYVVKKIGGMIQMVAGIPYVYHLKGNPERPMTFACSQTLPSIKETSPEIYPQALDASVRLAKLTFGAAAHGTTPEIPPLYSLNLKRNDRSGNLDGKVRFDGSYSLATTIIKGEGQGSVAPAVQATGSGAAQIRAVLATLHELQGLIGPICLSKFEKEIQDFHSDMNNVVTFGGLKPAATSCQKNVSSRGDDLTKYMGKDQGGPHVDEFDANTRMSMLITLLRIGPSKSYSKSLLNLLTD